MGLTKPRAAQIYNLDYKQATRVVTVVSVTLVGGAPSSVDGVSLSTNDRVLVTAQNTASENGLYYVTTVGSGSNGTWTRTGDANQTGEIDAGMIVMVTEGTIYADTQWKLITDNPITVGTTGLTFTQNYKANSISSGSSNVTVNANANVTVSSAGTANVLTVSSTGTVTTGTASISGNVTGANILTGGLVSATGNINGNYLNANIYYATGFSASRIFSGTSEANIGTAGGNANISIGGTANVAVFATTGEYVTGLLSATGNITGANITTAGLITATGNVYTGNILTNGYYYANGAVFGGGGGGGTPGGSNTYVQFNDNGVFNGSAGFTFIKTTNALSTTGTFSATGNITGGNISATNYTGTNVSVTGTVTAASTVGGVITGSSVSVTGTVTAASTVGGVITGSSASVTGTVTAASTVGGVITGSSASVTGTVTAASTVGGVITGSSVSVSGNITGGNVLGGANVNATTHTGTSVSVTGTVTGGNIVTAGQLTVNSGANTTAIVNGATNGVGNIGASGAAFNTVFAKATTAQYADLAEMYAADADYAPGTVVEFGGANEITVTTASHSTQAAGIISTDPAYLMNSTQAGEHPLEVALVGRVPCSVVGTIRKGDRLVSSNIPGVAQTLDANLYQPGCIIGKALEEYNSAEPGVIEVAVGRL